MAHHSSIAAGVAANNRRTKSYGSIHLPSPVTSRRRRATSQQPHSTSPDSQQSSFSDSLPTLRQLQLHHLSALVCSLLILALISLLPIYGWSSPSARPALLPEFTIGAIGYLSTITLQQPFFSCLNWLFHFHIFRPAFRQDAPLALHAVLQEGIRLLVIAAIATPVRSMSGPHIHPHESFYHAFWLGLGYAAAEVIYKSLALWRDAGLYADVLDRNGVTLDRNWEEESVQGEEEDEIDEDLLELERARLEEHLIAVRRADLEDGLGQPLYSIPTALLCLWTVNRVLLSLAMTLLVYSAFVGRHTLYRTTIAPMFIAVTIFHAIQSLAWSLSAPVVGLAMVSYIATILNLLAFFLALGIWGAIA